MDLHNESAIVIIENDPTLSPAEKTRRRRLVEDELSAMNAADERERARRTPTPATPPHPNASRLHLDEHGQLVDEDTGEIVEEPGTEGARITRMRRRLTRDSRPDTTAGGTIYSRA